MGTFEGENCTPSDKNVAQNTRDLLTVFQAGVGLRFYPPFHCKRHKAMWSVVCVMWEIPCLNIQSYSTALNELFVECRYAERMHNSH